MLHGVDRKSTWELLKVLFTRRVVIAMRHLSTQVVSGGTIDPDLILRMERT